MAEEIGRISFIRERIGEWKESDPLLENKEGFLEFIEFSEPGKVPVKDSERWVDYLKKARRKHITVSELLFDWTKAAIPPPVKMKVEKRRFQVITTCPIHDRPVYLIVEALGLEEAAEKALGKTVSCPWGPIDTETHDFVVEKVLSVTFYPWTPPVTVSAAPIPSAVVREMTTSELGERFWILSRKGQEEFGEIQRGVEEAVRLAPVSTPTERRGGGSVIAVLILLGLSLPVAYLLYRWWKERKS